MRELLPIEMSPEFQRMYQKAIAFKEECRSLDIDICLVMGRRREDDDECFTSLSIKDGDLSFRMCCVLGMHLKERLVDRDG